MLDIDIQVPDDWLRRLDARARDHEHDRDRLRGPYGDSAIDPIEEMSTSRMTSNAWPASSFPWAERLGITRVRLPTGHLDRFADTTSSGTRSRIGAAVPEQHAAPLPVLQLPADCTCRPGSRQPFRGASVGGGVGGERLASRDTWRLPSGSSRGAPASRPSPSSRRSATDLHHRVPRARHRHHVNDFLISKGWRLNALQLPPGLHVHAAEHRRCFPCATPWSTRDVGPARSGALYGLGGSPRAARRSTCASPPLSTRCTTWPLTATTARFRPPVPRSTASIDDAAPFATFDGECADCFEQASMCILRSEATLNECPWRRRWAARPTAGWRGSKSDGCIPPVYPVPGANPGSSTSMSTER